MQNFKNKLRAFVRGENASSLALTAVVLAVAVVLNVLLYVLDVNYGLYFRAEDDEDYTVSDAAADRFAEAEREGKEVTILFCRAEDDVSTHATGAYVYETARQLAEKYPDFIRLDFVNITRGRSPVSLAHAHVSSSASVSLSGALQLFYVFSTVRCNQSGPFGRMPRLRKIPETGNLHYCRG